MSIKKLAIEFVTVFAMALTISAMVTLLWNIIGHGEIAIDWETSLQKFGGITALGHAAGLVVGMVWSFT